MSLATWNGNLSGYDNVKSNVLADRMAKNRWGSKFKRLYNPLRDAENRVDFTIGMLNCAGTDVNGIVEELEQLRDALISFFTLSDGSSATPNSYFAVLASTPYSQPLKIDNIKCSLSLSTPKSEDDQRRVSRFFVQNGENSNSSSYLEPIDSFFERVESVESSYYKPFYSTNQLSLFTEDGTTYGHIEADATLDSTTTDETVLGLYGVIGDSTLFENSINFLTLLNDYNLEKWFLKFVEYSSSLEQNPLGYNGKISIIFGADLVIAWIEENLSSWYAYLNSFDETRGYKELELIEHLRLCDTLKEEIGGHARDISKIWFEFKKEVNPPLIIIDGKKYFDSNYKWWEEEQFKEIKRHFKNFHLCFNLTLGKYDDVDTIETTPSYVYLKNEAFTLSGWKIYWLVLSTLSIDSRAKKRSFFETLFSFVMLFVAIYLTAVSGNPVWLKVVLIGVTLASYSGALSPKAQLLVAVVMFVYGLSATNIAAMSTAQLFQWAVSNIEMVYKMVKMYENIKLEDEQQDENVMIHEKQERIMRFIYEDAYSQYDNLYGVMYDYEPKYK